MQGGIVAYAWNTDSDSINNCTFEGNAEGTNAGGIAGSVPGNGWGAIQNCSNYGTIKGYSCAGGMTGSCSSNYFKVKNCKNYGKIQGVNSGAISGEADNLRIEKCYNNSMVIGSNSAAGFVGYSYLPNIYIINCGNNINSTIQGENYAGGLFGMQGNRGNIYIYNSYSLGNIKGNNNIGGINGNSYVSGGSSKGFIKIENSYFGGKIEGGKNIGGIIGSIGVSILENISFSNCYYINTVSKGISNYEDENIISMSEEDMRGNDTLFNSLKSYTNSEYELSEWKKDANQYPVHKDQ